MPTPMPPQTPTADPEKEQLELDLAAAMVLLHNQVLVSNNGEYWKQPGEHFVSTLASREIAFAILRLRDRGLFARPATPVS